MLKTAVAIRHVAFEDLGSFEPGLRHSGYQIRYCDIGIDDLSSLSTQAPDLLVILGAPIGVYDEDRYPFLREELRILAERLAAQKPMLGICLGAQLMARALGAKVYAGPEKEIGFAPIRLSEQGRMSCLLPLADGPVLHWHGDTFDLPRGATLLASTDAYPNQAFSLGANALGVQFHPEASEQGFERWLIGHATELCLARKDVRALRNDALSLGQGLRARASACLAEWLRQLAHD